MIYLFKKIVSAFLILCLIFNITVFAEESFNLKLKGEFYTYEENPKKVEEILKISQNDLKEIFEKGTLYLAVNKKNTKQIRITQSQNNFTYSIVNISNLTDDKIKALLPQITGIEGIKGEVINKDGQKFIKTVLRSTDSGGDYVLTEYITVADKKSYVLSFYTDIDENTDYIDETFDSFDSKLFFSDEEGKVGLLNYVLPVLTVVFAVFAVVIGITLIFDMRKKRKEEESYQDEEAAEAGE